MRAEMPSKRNIRGASSQGDNEGANLLEDSTTEVKEEENPFASLPMKPELLQLSSFSSDVNGYQDSDSSNEPVLPSVNTTKTEKSQEEDEDDIITSDAFDSIGVLPTLPKRKRKKRKSATMARLMAAFDNPTANKTLDKPATRRRRKSSSSKRPSMLLSRYQDSLESINPETSKSKTKQSSANKRKNDFRQVSYETKGTISLASEAFKKNMALANDYKKLPRTISVEAKHLTANKKIDQIEEKIGEELEKEITLMLSPIARSNTNMSYSSSFSPGTPRVRIDWEDPIPHIDFALDIVRMMKGELENWNNTATIGWE